MAEQPLVRWLVQRDMPDAIRIGGRTEEELKQWLRQRNCIGMVAEVGGICVAGYMVYRLGTRFLEVLDFQVDPRWRRKGIGTAMIRKLQQKLGSHKRCRIALSLPDTNLEGHLFLRSLGFRAYSMARGDGPDHPDSYLFEYIHRPIPEPELVEVV